MGILRESFVLHPSHAGGGSGGGGDEITYQTFGRHFGRASATVFFLHTISNILSAHLIFARGHLWSGQQVK